MFARQSWLTKKHNKNPSSDSLGKHAFSNRIFIKLYIRKQKSRKHWHSCARLLPLGLVQNLLKCMCWPSCQVGSPNSHMKATASLAAEATLVSLAAAWQEENNQAELCSWRRQHPQAVSYSFKLLHLAELKKLEKIYNGVNQTYARL